MIRTPAWFFSVCSLLLVSFSVAAQPESDAYKLGAGDHIIIQVFDEDELSMDFRLNSTGILNYPFLGELNVAGLTVLELENLISNGLRGKYLIDPKVTVSIREYRSFFINGEVKHPGGYPYQPSLTVEKAVSLAGGFTERASRKYFSAVRADDPNKTVLEVIANDPVYPGDVITVNRSFF